MTGWTLFSVVAILLLGVVALSRRSSRARQTGGPASAAETETSPRSVSATASFEPPRGVRLPPSREASASAKASADRRSLGEGWSADRRSLGGGGQADQGLKPAATGLETGSTPDLGAEVLEHLRRIEAKGSPGLAAQVIEIFLQDAATRLKTLREAVARRDGEAACRVAHTLQGSASMVGAVSVARNCAELIQAARSESFDRCEAIVAELDAGVNAIQRVV